VANCRHLRGLHRVYYAGLFALAFMGFSGMSIFKGGLSMDPVLVKSALIAVAVLDASDCSSHRLGSCGQKFSVKANPKVEEVWNPCGAQ